MRIHSLRSRIALVFVLLMLAVQAAVFVVISTVIASNAHRNVEDQLSVGERVFQEVLHSNAGKLTQAASVVAADFGFRAAVASHDQTTVTSALQNHGDRINADVVMLVGLDGKLIADSRGPTHAGEPFAFPGLIRKAEHSGDASTIGVINGRPYQLVAVPVKAPLVIAWVTMGFAIDDALARETRGLTSLDVSFLGKPDGKHWTVLATSLEHTAREPLQASIAAAPADPRAGPFDLIDDYGTRVVLLASDGEPVVAILQRSLKEAMAPYHRLQTTLFILTLIGVAVSIGGSVFTARSVTRPIGALTRFSQRIGQGDYSEPIEVSHRDEIGELAAAFNQMREGIAERETRIMDLAYQDRLTGLPNRALFNDRLQQAIVVALRLGHPLSAMMMDLDRFKYVNDTLGHHIGDLLLDEVGKRLRANLLRASDTVARLGGDEFAILLPTDNVDAAKIVAARLLKALETPIVVEGQVVDVGASIGIVSCPENGRDMHTLLRRADVAMYTAKRANTGFAIYDERDDQHSAERLSLMSELRHAVEHDELTLHYQPKVDLATRAVKYVEALVRWEHPTRGFIAPDQFIPFAEQTGYIKSISRWVAEKAIRQCAQWHALGLDLKVSINVSARDLMHAELPETLDALLRKYEVDPGSLWIEITESAIMDDPNHAIATLDQLHRLGIRLSIDDFGTGYSSLSYLKRMPVHELKIDRSFVMGMADDKDDETIVRSTINLGHNMGLKVVAEGVEDAATLEHLKTLRCDLAQGYHVSRPLPPDKLESWLVTWHDQSEAQLREADAPV
ncbi:EAL domain-containing protein [Paraburkholderia bryophila]|uniref:putative bifunctional diguanylate cyclase/phosphodiesterase n=1 Tax=Burkholderiaceae TaxID=119060 RepID=UPI00068B272E|nr:EAL domain-containing protein [Burkholderia sp. 9120]